MVETGEERKRTGKIEVQGEREEGRREEEKWGPDSQHECYVCLSPRGLDNEIHTSNHAPKGLEVAV